MMKRASRVAAALLLAACATHPVSNSEADKVEASAYTKPLPDGSRLTVKRDRGMMGAACKVAIYLDGEKVASLGTSDLVTLYIPAGEHIVGAKNGSVCGGAVSESAFTIAPNAAKTYRVAILDAGGIAIQPTAF